MTRVILTALIPVWLFAWTAGGVALLNWATNKANRNAWWSLPITMAVMLPGLSVMVGGLMFVFFMWIGGPTPR